VYRQLCLLSLSCLVAAFVASTPALSASGPAGAATLRVKEIVWYRFKGGADGAHPQRRLMMGHAGNLYGTTLGTNLIHFVDCRACGTVFEISGRTHAERVLHAFSGGADGAYPAGGVIFDKSGNLYGVTQFGGSGCTASASRCGTVFEISAHSHTESILHSFLASGAWPDGGLVMDSGGNLYGETSTGTCPNGHYGCGTVFEISAGTRQEIVLHKFSRGGDLVGFPRGRLVMDRIGNLYGTTWNANQQGHVTGIVFEISARTHEMKILHAFVGGSDGENPNGGLLIDRQGNLYGTTQQGGGFCDANGSPGIDADGCGTVFEISARSHKETILYRFKGVSDGMDPRAGLVMDSAGNLYGTTAMGGIDSLFGQGTVFEIAAGTHEKTTLYSFKGGRDGDMPEGALLIDGAGDLYGTTFRGGTGCPQTADLGPGCGTVFEIVRK
jgi:uncharacterized repeat protein (TIGR03803 family)